MADLSPIPSHAEPFVMGAGVNPVWYEWWKAIEKAIKSFVRFSNFYVNALDYSPPLDGVTDATTALQTAIDAADGKTLYFGDGYTYIISAPLVMKDRSKWIGSSCIKLKSGTVGNLTPLVDCRGKTGWSIDGLEIDGNGNSTTGTTYGIWTQGGSDISITSCKIHDTRQAGIRIDDVDGARVRHNRLDTCGRNLGTDNHGIMFVAVGADCKNIDISDNIIDGAYRKGITSTGFTPHRLSDVTISRNKVYNSGLALSSGGGIYVGTFSGALLDSLTLSDNICEGNYVNYEIDRITNSTIVGNVARSSAAQGWHFSSVEFTTVSGNSSYGSTSVGIDMTGCTELSVSGNVVAFPGTGEVGIHVANSTFCMFASNKIRGLSGPTMPYGIAESGTSDANFYVGTFSVNVVNTGNASVSLTGGSSSAADTKTA